MSSNSFDIWKSHLELVVIYFLCIPSPSRSWANFYLKLILNLFSINYPLSYSDQSNIGHVFDSLLRRRTLDKVKPLSIYRQPEKNGEINSQGNFSEQALATWPSFPHPSHLTGLG